MPKKGKSNPKGGTKKSKQKEIKIQGFGKANLKSDILKPLKKTLSSQSSDFTSKDWKTIKSDIKSLASDGKIGKNEQIELQKILSSSTGKSGLSNSEGWLAQGAITNQFGAIKYDSYINKQTNQIDSFSGNLNSNIGQIMMAQQGNLKEQLSSIQSGAKSSLAAYQSMLSQAMAASGAINAQQRSVFERQNAESEKAIKRFQSRISGLPDTSRITQISDRFKTIDKVNQISSDFEKVVGMSAFEKLNRQMNPITLQRTPTTTGFSKQQEASSARQQQGIQGFRSKQVA